MRPRLLLATFLSSVAALAASVPSAHAALPITFDGLANLTLVDNQFAADGVVFLGQPDGSTGLPEVNDVGIKANSGSKVAFSTCSGCEFVHNVIKGQLSSLRETVVMRVGINNPTPVSVTLRLEAMSAGQSVIASTDATVGSSDFKTLMAVDGPGTNDIAFFRLRTINGGEAGYQFGIDDVDYSGGGTDPDFAVSPSTAGVRVRQGGSATLPVQVFRFSGSDGNVTMSAGGLPSGVTVGGFAPNPVGGSTTATSTLTLNASTSATLGTTFTSSVTGTPAGALIGPAPRTSPFTLTVEKAFDVSLPSEVRLPSCGSVTTNVVVSRALSGFNAPIDLAVSGLPAGYTATLATTTAVDPMNGTFAQTIPLTITRTGAGDLVNRTVTVTGSSAGVPDQSDSATVARFAGEITSVAPASGNVPRDLRPGTETTLNGRGFCPGSQVQFGNAFARAVPESIDITGTSLRVRVPRYATSGAVSVVAPDGAFTGGGTFTVVSPRNTEGFRFNNYDHPGVDIDTLRQVYGEDQTNITLDLCWPFGCDVVTPLPNPLTYLYILISDAALAGNGSCFGIAVNSQHVTTGLARIAQFAPAGATSAWQLDATSGPAAALRQRIRAWHTTQLSSNFLQHWLATAAANAINSGSSQRTAIENELRAGRNPIVSLRNGGGGHVLVIHDVRSNPAGGYFVDVYDPNLEFLTSEDTNGTDHRNREDNSTITVRPGGGWTHPGAYSGGAWSGGPGDMVVAPLSVLGSKPRMPTTLSGLASLIVPFADSGAGVSQVTDASGRKLLDDKGALNTDAATRIPDATIVAGLVGGESGPLYLLKSSGTYTQTLTGAKAGTTGTSMVGPGMAAHLQGLSTTKGSTDRVRLVSGSGLLDVDAARGGNLRARLARSSKSGLETGADVSVGGGDAGDHGFRLNPSGSGFAYANDGSGAARVTVTLSGSSGSGLAGSATLPAVTVPAGGSVRAKPRSWAGLTTSAVAITVRNRAGRVVRRITYRPRVARRVSGVRVSGRTRSGNSRTVTVRARFRGVPKAAKVLVSLHVRRGKKLVATRTATISASRARGTRTTTFRLSLPDGAYTLRGSAAVMVQTTRGFAVSRASARATFRAR